MISPDADVRHGFRVPRLRAVSAGRRGPDDGPQEAAFRAGRGHRRSAPTAWAGRSPAGRWRGAKVVVAARTPRRSPTTLAEIEAAGSEGSSLEPTSPIRDEVDSSCDAAVERFGRIDTYVANAMVTVYAEAHRLEDDELRRVFDVNFFGGVYGYWAALPHLTESHGHVPARQLGPRLPRDPAPGRVLRVEGGGAHLPRVGARRAPEARRRVDVSRRPPGRDQHAAVRPLPPAARLPAAAGAADLPARAVRGGRAALLRAPGPRASASAGAPRSSSGARSSRRAPATSCCCASAGRASTRASRSPSTRPTTSSSPLPGDPGAHGRFDDQARASTLWTSLACGTGAWFGAGLARVPWGGLR